MSTDNGNGADHRDPELDALLRAVAAGEPEDAVFPVDEADLLDYLAGDADDATTARIRGALADSSALRRELVEIAADVDRLKEIVETPAPWAEARARARRPDPWRRLQEFMAGFWRQPAFVAAAAVFLLMAYPTFRYLGDGGDGPPIGPARTLHLDAGGAALRGEGDAPLPRLTPAPDAAAVTVTLWSDAPYAAGEQVGIEVRSGERLVWSTADWPVTPDRQEPERLDLRLDTRALDPGPVTITVTRGAGTTERYMFEMD